MSNQTPWPWHKGISMDGLFIEGGNRRVVCRMIPFDQEGDLDLIISAPELVKVMRSLLVNPENSICPADIKAARDIIARAGG
jgi:hypothetical protein